MTTSKVPKACAGVVHVVCVYEFTVHVAVDPPKVTVWPVMYPVPVITTEVPPATGPAGGRLTIWKK